MVSLESLKILAFFLLLLVAGIVEADPAVQTKQSPTKSAVIIADDAIVQLIAEVRVPASEAGMLKQLKVKEGDLVKTGQLLGQLNNKLVVIDHDLAKLEYDIAVEKSKNDIDERFALKSQAVAKTELTLSQNAVRRVPGSISVTELDRLRLVVERSTLSIEQAQRDLRIAKLTKNLKERSVRAAKERVTRRQILAPINGIVAEVLTQAGEWLNPGDPVIRLIRMDRLRVEVRLDGNLYGKELLGRPVQFQVKVPPGDRIESFKGKVTFVSPEVQPVNGKVRVWAEVDNRSQLLRPGIHGKLTILTKDTNQK